MNDWHLVLGLLSAGAAIMLFIVAVCIATINKTEADRALEIARKPDKLQNFLELIDSSEGTVK